MTLEKEFLRKQEELSNILYYVDFAHITNLFSNGNKRFIKKIETIQNRKLEKLIYNKMGHDPDQVLYNFSSHILSDNEKSLLYKGLNFSLPPKKLKFDNYILPFELPYRNIKHSDKTNKKIIYLKSKIQDIGLSSFRLYNKKDHKFDNISENKYSALLSLIENQNLIIQKAHKGNNIVVLNKEDYIEKLEEILSDEDKFEKATFEENKANKELRYILNMEETIKQTLDHFRQKITSLKMITINWLQVVVNQEFFMVLQRYIKLS